MRSALVIDQNSATLPWQYPALATRELELNTAVVTEAMRAGAAARELDALEGDAEALPHREKVLLARRVVVREIGIMTVGVILVVTLLLRAAQSG